jgi:chromosome partitioning protein
MGRVVAIASQKGGVGKTTTAINLSACLAELGQRVLLVDMDPQGSAGSGIGISPNGSQPTIYEPLVGVSSISEAILHDVFPKLDVIPSGTRLSGAEVELVGVLARENKLRQALAPIREEYDFIFLDCPPSLGLLTVNALAAADSVLIPLQCEYYALEGLTALLTTIQLVQESLNPNLTIEGILLTMYDARLNLSQQVSEDARRYFAGRIYDTTIPRNVRLGEAPSFGRPVIEYDTTSKGSESYRALAREVLNHE